MKKYVNGEYVEMTPEEIDEMKANLPTIPEQPKDALEERMKRLEQGLSKVTAFFEKLGWG